MKKIIVPVIIAIVFLGIGFYAGMQYQSYKIAKAFKEALTTTSPVSTTANETPTPATMMQAAQQAGMKTIDKKVGDDISMDTGKILVNSVSETQTLSGTYSNPAVASQGTKFVVINLTLTNTTNSDYTFSPDEAFTLVDNANREYHAFLNQLDTDLTYKGLSPSVPVTGTLVYQIPTDATGYALVSSKASTKELYKIVLK